MNKFLKKKIDGKRNVSHNNPKGREKNFGEGERD